MGTLETVQTALVNANVASGAGGTGAWPCFIGIAPDVPNQVIAIQWTGGFAQDTQQGDNLLQTFQVLVRAAELGHSTCESKWYAMFRALENASGLTDIYLIQAMSTGPLAFLDAKNRTCMTANFRVVRANT